MDVSQLPDACIAADIDGVALTEHNPADLQGARDHLNATGLLLIPAREVSYLHAHLLVYSEDEEYLRALPRRITDPGILARTDTAVVWAHPGAPSGSSAYAIRRPDSDTLSEIVHGVEILNGRHLHFPEAIEVAMELKTSIGSAGTGGSDAHVARDVGRTFTLLDAERNVASVVRSIRTGRVRPALGSAWAKLHGYHYRPSLEEFLA